MEAEHKAEENQETEERNGQLTLDKGNVPDYGDLRNHGQVNPSTHHQPMAAIEAPNSKQSQPHHPLSDTQLASNIPHPTAPIHVPLSAPSDPSIVHPNQDALPPTPTPLIMTKHVDPQLLHDSMPKPFQIGPKRHADKSNFEKGSDITGLIGDNGPNPIGRRVSKKPSHFNDYIMG